MKILPVSLLIFVPLLLNCSDDSDTADTDRLPDRIVTERGGFIPEGIEYDTLHNRFLTGSLADGTIYEITPTGQLIALVTDPDLIASVGIEVDEPRNRLLVANSDRQGGSGAIMLGIYDLSSGAQLAMVDLTASISGEAADASHFANDVAVSGSGVVFVTDSRTNVVYQVDRYNHVSILIDFGRDSTFGLNGIEYHPAGYLILVSPRTGELIKVPVNNPDNWSVVELDFPATGGDGLVWSADGNLVATSNNRAAVMKYRSDDHWLSARLVAMASFEGQATTAAAVGDAIYVIQPHFSDQDPPVILRVKF